MSSSTVSDTGNATSTAGSSSTSTSGATAGETSISGDPRSSGVRLTLPVIVGIVIAAVITLFVLGILGFVLLSRRRWRWGRSHTPRIDRHKHDKRFYGEDVNTRSYVSSTESVALEARLGTPLISYIDAIPSEPSSSPALRFHEAHEHHSVMEPSPTGSVPLMGFPAPPSLNDQSLPRIVVTGTETSLVGPDNSMARYARQKVAEREAELTRRMREMEAALAAKYGVRAQPTSADLLLRSVVGNPTTPARADSVRSTESGSEAALRGQLEELRAEIARMQTVQQQMALELRDATNPPPEYQ